MSIDAFPLEPSQPDYMLVTSTTRPSSPAKGQLIYESDTDLIRWWDGAAWRTLPGVKITSWPNHLVGAAVNPETSKVFMQGGTHVVQTNASGDVTLTYPTAFPNGLLSFMCWQGDNTHAGATYETYLGGAALSYQKVRVYNSSGGEWANSGFMRVNWIAIGW
jgi:hypothetical protein